MDGRGTFNLLGIVDDEIAVPYDGEVHCQVTDLNTLVHVLKSRNRLSQREEKDVEEVQKKRKKITHMHEKTEGVSENEWKKGQEERRGF